MKKIAILQSNYIPWKGYFDLIASVDEFIFYDTVQYTKNDWRNRNQIKSYNGLTWLTIPVKFKGKFKTSINAIEVDGDIWKVKHLKTLMHYYSRSLFYKEVLEILAPLYEKKYSLLCEVNYEFVRVICDYLDIKTKLSFASDFVIDPGQTEALISLCKQTNASTYISGPAAKDYLNVKLMEEANIKVNWFDYSGYPLYNQLHGEFIHNVSIVDLLFNSGKTSKKYMKCL